MGVSKGMEFLGQRCSYWAERLLEELPDYNSLMDGRLFVCTELTPSKTPGEA